MEINKNEARRLNLIIKLTLQSTISLELRTRLRVAKISITNSKILIARTSSMNITWIIASLINSNLQLIFWKLTDIKENSKVIKTNLIITVVGTHKTKDTHNRSSKATD